jgi:hypothetical protein
VDEVRYRGEAGDGRVFGNHDGALGAGPCAEEAGQNGMKSGYADASRS